MMSRNKREGTYKGKFYGRHYRSYHKVVWNITVNKYGNPFYSGDIYKYLLKGSV